MEKERKPFTVDHVGSFLRPERLKEARQRFSENRLTENELRSIENEEIKKLVDKQKGAGLKGITDGEFRRGFWHIDFLENLQGVEGYVPSTGYNQKFHGKAAPAYNIRVIDKLSFNEEHPFFEDFLYLKELVETEPAYTAKATIPSPTMLLRQELLANTGDSNIHEIYPDIEEFFADLANVYQQTVAKFYELGCRYLQFDDTNWAFLADANKQEELKERGIDPKAVAAICTSIINGALENKPDDLTVTTHICRGNHASSWLFSGGYEPIAEELFATNYDGYFLEYDSDRAGDFAPLRYWSGDKKVVLGLVTSKFPELEDPESVKLRIAEAAEYIPLSHLSISPQCGFASTEEGNKLTEEQQWQKIQLLHEIAQDVWA